MPLPSYVHVLPSEGMGSPSGHTMHLQFHLAHVKNRYIHSVKDDGHSHVEFWALLVKMLYMHFVKLTRLESILQLGSIFMKSVGVAIGECTDLSIVSPVEFDL